MVGESTSAITLQQRFGWLAVFHLQMYVLRTGPQWGFYVPPALRGIICSLYHLLSVLPGPGTCQAGNLALLA